MKKSYNMKIESGTAQNKSWYKYATCAMIYSLHPSVFEQKGTNLVLLSQ